MNIIIREPAIISIGDRLEFPYFAANKSGVENSSIIRFW
jgi:hypothetical protein